MEEHMWKNVAEHILKSEKEQQRYCRPEPTGVLVEWRRGEYMGHIQDATKQYNDIVALSKTTEPLPTELLHEIKRQDPSRLKLTADNSLGLDGRSHIVRKIDNKLTVLTPEQTIYMTNHPLIVLENYVLTQQAATWFIESSVDPLHRHK